MPVYYTATETPVGVILLAGDGDGLCRVVFPSDGEASSPDPEWQRDDDRLAEAVEQLRGYFAGERKAFDLPLSIEGTSFERSVWAALQRIPFGKTASYGEVARRLGSPKATRAVGRANGKNPLPIVIPCHRVLGANGQLTGFAGGVGLKRELLEHERRHGRDGGVQMRLL